MGLFSKVVGITKGGIEYYVIGIETVVSGHVGLECIVRTELVAGSMVSTCALAIGDKGTVII
jgi:hypothetical protein